MKKPWRTTSAARPTSGISSNGSTRLNKPSPQSVRGRISNPIAVVSPLDDEFPMRHPGTGIAAVPSEEPAKEQTTKESEPEQPKPIETDKIEVPEAPDAQPTPEPEHVTVVEPKDSPTQTQPPPAPQPAPEPRAATSATIRHSVVSSDTARTKSSKGKPEKKKSGLRGALGKLFGRKKKTDSVIAGTNGTTPQQDGSNQHRSDPTALRRTPSKLDAKRSVSLPVTEYDRALRSHSVGPDDVIAIDSARNSLAADGLLSRKRAGAASTHLIGVRGTRDTEWAGLSPRPASAHGMHTAAPVIEEQDPTQIGRAITSDFTGLKRRSRSLSFLANVPPEDEDDQQRRSHELRYWRQSYEPNLMSPISSNTEDHTDGGPLSMDIPRQTDQDLTVTPPQPFTFGDMATMNEMAGMRITDAVSMDSRIGSLEARMQRMESVVTQLCNALPNFKPRVEAPSRAAPPPPDETASGYTLSIAPLKGSAYPASGREMQTSTRPSTQNSQLSKASFGDAPTFVDSVPRSLGQPALDSNDRPLSTATIRGATSLPSLIKDSHQKQFTIDHYTTLMALIDTERSARQALEAQVKVLGHQVSIMSKTIRKRNGRTNSTASGIQRSAFDVDEDEEDELYAALAKHRRDSNVDRENDDDESEAFTTPHEEGQTFDEQLRQEEQRRKTARTLSLSRLTLGGAHE